MTFIQSVTLILLFSVSSITLASDLIDRSDLVDKSAEQLAQKFCAAHDAADYSAIENLIHWDGIEQARRKETEQQIRSYFSLKTKRCYASKQPSIFSTGDFKLKGKTYGLNLKPAGTLVVEFISVNGMNMNYIIGKNDGKYLITVSVPR